MFSQYRIRTQDFNSGSALVISNDLRPLRDFIDIWKQVQYERDQIQRERERESRDYLEAKRKILYLWGRRSLFIAYALGLQQSSDQSVKWLLDIRAISEQFPRYLVIILLL